MATHEVEVNKFFAAPDQKLPQDVMTELLHIMQLMSLTPEDLYYKWDSYVITMGADSTKLDYKTVRDFKKTLQDALERDSRKAHIVKSETKRTTATPRAGAGAGNDVFGMLDGMVTNTPSSRVSAAKRRGDFATPAAKSVRSGMNSSPADNKTPATKAGPAIAFEDRNNAGDVVEAINTHLPAAKAPDVPHAEARVKLKAAVDLPKFAYKPMAMKLSEASEILDDRIDSFVEVLQKHYELEDSAFGNPAAQSANEIVAVGRIACDQPTGKLNSSSMVLETSRRMGAGMRVPLRVADDVSYDFFLGKIVGLRGTNVSGEYFAATEVLAMPKLPPAASRVQDVEVNNDRLTGVDGETRPLSILAASGPYTMENDLSFAPLYTLLEKAENEKTDVLILMGPFLDLEHPIVASGDFEPYLPSDAKIEPDQATVTDVFRILISQHIQKLAQAVPTITIVMVPSMRDAVSKHVSWPQDRVPKPALGLPRQVQFVTNPMALSINEMVVGMSSQDVLSELRSGNVHHSARPKPLDTDLMGRLAGHVIEQSHYFPVFPPQAREDLPKPAGIDGEVPEPGGEERYAIGANIDLAYYKLGEFWQARPDVLILPSTLMPFARVSCCA